MIRKLDSILCPSRFTLEKHRQDGIEARFVHLPFFVPVPTEAARDSKAPPYFLVVARLEKIKGIQTEEFWELQATFSSTARKRLAAAPGEEIEKLRKEFLETCRRAISYGGKLAYPYAAFFVTAHKP